MTFRTGFRQNAFLGLVIGFALGIVVLTQTGHASVGQGTIRSVDKKISPRSFEITIAMSSGEFTNNSKIEVLLPNGTKTVGSIVLPDLLPKISKPQLVRRVQLNLDADAVITDGLSVQNQGGAPASARAAVATRADAIVACPYSPEELTRILGVGAYAPGRETASEYAGVVSKSCLYVLQRGMSYSVRVSQIAMKDGSPTQSIQSRMAGNIERISGDPDHAGWQMGQGDLQEISLVYNRKNVDVNVRFGIPHADHKVRDKVEAARRKVMQLRRLP